MPDVVRVSANGRWAYIPVGGQAHQHLLRFAESGMANADAVEVRLRSDAGPMFWDIIDDEIIENAPPTTLPVMALTENGISILPGEEISFGKTSNGAYNDYADMSWSMSGRPKLGIPLSNRNMDEGDIVLTAWPTSGRLIPAKVEKFHRDLVLKLIEAQPGSERCFVTDDSGGLMTVSLKSSNSNTIRIMPQQAMNSWLFSLGTKAIRQKSGRFSVERKNDRFIITDSKNRRKFGGKFRTSNPESEIESIEVMLGHGGLGEIVPQYDMRKS